MENINILVVEDQELDYELLLMKLKVSGFRVDSARVQTGLEMCQALERSDWDAIIADYWMPGFSGKEALLIFQRDGRDIPFLFYSGHLGEELLVECMRLGAHDFVVKGNPRLIPALRRELKDAEQRREQKFEQERYRSIVDDSDDGVCCVGADEKILFINQRFADLLAIEPEWVVGQDLTSLAELQADWVPYLTPPHQPLKGVPAKLAHSKMESREIHFSLWPLKGGGLVIKITDLSGPRLLEKRLALASKMEAIGRLAGSLAHDFNNTLSIVSGFCDVLKEATEEPALLSILDTMHQTVRRGTTLCHQMMSVGKLGKEPELGKKEIRVNELVQSCESILRKASGGNSDFRLICSAEQDKVRFDGDLLLQVLVNLTLNAKDALEETSDLETRKILITTQDFTLDENESLAQSNLLKAGNYVVLSVSDNGVGMDEATRARAFEPYFTTKEDRGGTGLGLASVYVTVAQHGGHIWVYSEKESGTSFKIYLPLVDQRPAVPSLTEAPRSQSDQVVLVVDDCALTREMTCSALEDEPYQLLQAGSGREALDKVRDFSGQIDLVISDVVMPGMKGPELVERLRSEIPELSVIFTSGYGREFCALPNPEHIPHRFVEKPMCHSNLVRQTRLALSGKGHSRNPVRGT